MGAIDMKKIFLVLFAVVFLGTFCLAEEPSTPPSKTTSSLGETKTFTGKIESVSICSKTSCGNQSEIVAVDAKGQKITFVVRSGIAVTVGIGERLFTLKELKKGSNVIIEYITNKNGINKAINIELTRYAGG